MKKEQEDDVEEDEDEDIIDDEDEEDKVKQNNELDNKIMAKNPDFKRAVKILEGLKAKFP